MSSQEFAAHITESSNIVAANIASLRERIEKLEAINSGNTTRFDNLFEYSVANGKRIESLESLSRDWSRIYAAVQSEFRRLWEESRQAIPQGQLVYNSNGTPLGVYIDGKIEKEARVTIADPRERQPFDLESLAATHGDSMPVQSQPDEPIPPNDDCEKLVKQRYPEATIKGFGYQYAVIIADGSESSGYRIIGSKCWFGHDAWESAAKAIQSQCQTCKGTGRISADPDPVRSVFDNDCVWSICAACGGRGSVEAENAEPQSAPSKSTETRQPWTIDRDHVIAAFPHAKSIICCSPNQYSISDELTGRIIGIDSHQSTHQAAWIDARDAVVMWQSGIRSSAYNDVHDNAAREGKEAIEFRETPDWVVALEKVQKRWPNAVCTRSADGNWEVTATRDEEFKRITTFIGRGSPDSAREAWVEAAKLKCLKETKEQSNPVQPESDWIIARREVLAKYPLASYRTSDGSIVDAGGIYHFPDLGEQEAWLDMADGIRKGQDVPQSSPATPQKAEWQLARDAVLAKYPDAKAVLVHPDADHTPSYNITGTLLPCRVGMHSESRAWVMACSMLGLGEFSYEDCPSEDYETRKRKFSEQESAQQVKAPSTPSPATSIWSREIPSESGWYWWRKDSNHDADMALIGSDEICTIIRFRGMTSHINSTYKREWPEAEFGPRIPDAETLAKITSEKLADMFRDKDSWGK